MVLNCHLFPPCPSMMPWCTCMRQLMGIYVICNCVWIAATSLTAHIKPRHARLSWPFKPRVWEDCNAATSYYAIDFSTSRNKSIPHKIYFCCMAVLNILGHFHVQYNNHWKVYCYTHFLASNSISLVNETWNVVMHPLHIYL